MKKLSTKRTIVVEGRYDAIKLDAIVQANVITTDGFRIYKNKEKQQLLKRLAQKDGLILLLDADAAGFQLRHYLTNIVGEKNTLQLYTPAVQGKEKRKIAPGKEGILGVEGIATKQLYDILATALAQDSANMPTQNECTQPLRQVTYADLFRWGLSGREGSAARKTVFLQSLDLPPRLSKKAMVEVLNQLYSYQELDELQKALFGA